jgi:sarcosine oxidase subunit gamma
MSEPQFRSSLAGVAQPKGLSISLTEITDLGMVDVRGDAGDQVFRTAVSEAIGCDLPVGPRTSLTAGEVSVLWLSVDQWLIVAPRRRVPDMVSALRSGLRNVHALAIDVSDARTLIRLEGEGVREVVMKGAPVDLTLPEYGVGSVRRLRFGDVGAMVQIRALSPDVIDLYVFRSYARFAWDWLEATAGEAARVRLYGPQPAPPVV